MEEGYNDRPAAEPVEGEQPKMIQREAPQVDPARAALVSRWQKTIRAAKKHHEDAFKQMRANMEYARLGSDGKWKKDGKYVANIVQRHINQAVASLYAKNPRAVAKRRERMEHVLWDGRPESIAEAQMTMQAVQQTMMAGAQAEMQTGMPAPMDPATMHAASQAQALLGEIQEVQTRKQMLDKLAKTLQLLFHYSLDEQEPKFKTSAKRMVRRTKVCSVGYVELGFQRAFERRPEITEQINDVSGQLATLERIAADIADGELREDAPEIAEMKASLASLQEQESVVAREGLIFTFPNSTSIIIDPGCKQLQGFVGARWLAKEMMLSADDVKETWKVDLGKNYAQYRDENVSAFERQAAGGEEKETKDLCAVWKVWDKRTGQCFVIADGYPDFLAGPKTPDVRLERFWPIFALVFNDVEDETSIFPPSDVEQMMAMQDEYNRAREGLREHRRANRPKYVVGNGRLDDKDRDLLRTAPAHAVLEINALQAGDKVEDLLQAIKHAPIDPALYDTNPLFEDVLRTVGTQESQFGPVDDGTATSASIAEAGRLSSVSSNVDDLDEMLTDMARAAGQVLLAEMSKESVVEIVGPGAVWPEVDRDVIAKEVHVEIKAGSSGRPNKAVEIANMERVTPILVQTPGISPMWLARTVLERLDDSIDVDDAIIEGLPSITAMNAMSGNPQPGTGDPTTDPAQQGPRGDGAVRNQDKVKGNEAGPQPAYPA